METAHGARHGSYIICLSYEVLYNVSRGNLGPWSSEVHEKAAYEDTKEDYCVYIA